MQIKTTTFFQEGLVLENMSLKKRADVVPKGPTKRRKAKTESRPMNEKLKGHLASMSDMAQYGGAYISCVMYEKEVAPIQWRIMRSDYDFSGTISCPCGKQHIQELCYIQNILTGAETFVGNVCIKRFSDIHKNVCIVAKKIRKDGITVEFESACCSHYHFHLVNTRAHSIVMYNDAMVDHFGSSPLNVETMRIRIEKSEDHSFDFVVGARYNINLRFERHATKNKLAYIITDAHLLMLPKQSMMHRDFEAYQADTTNYDVKMDCEAADARQVELYGGTKRIREKIKERWGGKAQFNWDSMRWIIFRDTYETLASIRKCLESM